MTKGPRKLRLPLYDGCDAFPQILLSCWTCCVSTLSLHSQLTALTVNLATELSPVSPCTALPMPIQLYPININRPEPECKTYVFGKTLV